MIRLLALLLLFGIIGCDNLSYNNKNIIELTLVCKNQWEPLTIFSNQKNKFIEQSVTQIIHVDIDLKKEEGSMVWETRGQEIPTHKTVKLVDIDDKEFTFYSKEAAWQTLNRTTLDIQAIKEYFICKKVDPI